MSTYLLSRTLSSDLYSKIPDESFRAKRFERVTKWMQCRWSSNLVPRVLWLFCKRVGARRDQPLAKEPEDSECEIGGAYEQDPSSCPGSSRFILLTCHIDCHIYYLLRNGRSPSVKLILFLFIRCYTTLF